MNKHNAGIAIALFAVLCVFCGNASASTVFYYTSSPESWVGQGESATVTPDDGFTFIVQRNYCNGVSFHIDNFTPIPDPNNMISWHLSFAAPYNVVLQPGQYENAIHFTYQYSPYPGLAFTGKGRANGSISGYFNVYEAVYGDDDEVISFAADFMQYDEGVEDAWSMGGIRYNSDYPIPEPSTLVLFAAGICFMFKRKKEYCCAKITVIILLFVAIVARITPASALIIDPSDDGSIYKNGGVSTTNYLAACEPTRGVVEFPTSQISWPITSAYLSVNPYGMPLWDKTVEVYGYESNDGQLTSLDYDAGNYLGIFYLPEDLGYREDAFFDVTYFMQGVSTPFVGFNLRTEYGEADVFSSLEYNSGHGAQLLVSPIPEPSTIMLLLAGISLLGFRKRRGS